MNERIRELFKKTALHRNDHTTEQRLHEVEKFAELIVKECIEALRLVPYHSLDIDFDEEVIYQDAIRKHFGVE
jgi:hypothetical protein